MALKVVQLLVGGFDNNFSYVVYETLSKEAFIVDPAGEIRMVMNVIQENELEPIGILLTHTHHDHWDQLEAVLNIFPIPVFVHEAGVAEIQSATEVVPIGEGTVLQLGSHTISTLHTPGHSPDSVCFYIDSADSDRRLPHLISGDTLFVRGCGKTTHKKASHLYQSLQRLKELPEDTVVMPGHHYGISVVSSIGQEKQNNLYLMAATETAFMRTRFPDEYSGTTYD